MITKVDVVDKETYAIPKNLVTRYDGHNLWFNIALLHDSINRFLSTN